MNQQVESPLNQSKGIIDKKDKLIKTIDSIGKGKKVMRIDGIYFLLK